MGTTRAVSGNDIYFLRGFLSQDRDLWKSDGTVAGTRQLVSSFGKYIAVAGSTLYTIRTTDARLVATDLDGTNARNVGATALSSIAVNVDLDGKLIFIDGTSLYCASGSNLTTLSTSLYRTSIYRPPAVFRAGPYVYFAALAAGDTGPVLWRTDGTTAGTIRLLTVTGIFSDTNPPFWSFTTVGDRIYFGAAEYPGMQRWWTSDGTPIGTHRVNLSQPIIPRNAIAHGSTIYFGGIGPYGEELYAFNAGSSCAPAAILKQPHSVTAYSGDTIRLTVKTSAVSPLTYQWYVGTRGDTTRPIKGAIGDELNLMLYDSAILWVRVTTACGNTDSSEAVVSVSARPAASAVPQNFVAQLTALTEAHLSWDAVSGASGYVVERVLNDEVTEFATTSNEYVDATLPPNTVAVYRVRVSNTPDIWSVRDFVTTVSFAEPLTAGVTFVKAQHVLELRSAAQLLLHALRVDDQNWPWSDGTALVGQRVKASHLDDLRWVVNAFRSDAGLPVVSFSNPSLGGGLVSIRKAHFSELRAALKGYCGAGLCN